MSLKTLTFTTLASAALLATGCSAVKLTPSEKDLLTELDAANYQPAPRTARDNIETQDILAQAAFWSHEHNLNPGDLEAAIKLAAVIRKMGNATQAVEITQQTRVLYPRDPYLLAEHSAALISANRAEEAIDILNTAIQNTPGYARLWSLKGVALDQIEQYDFARQHYDKALQLTPNDPNVLANIGLSHALAGDAKTGEIWLRRAVSDPGASQGVRQNLAIVLQLQGKDQEAQAYLPYNPNAAPTPKLAYRPQNAPAPTPVPQQQQAALPQAYAQQTAPQPQAPAYTSPQPAPQPQGFYPGPQSPQAYIPATANPPRQAPAPRGAARRR